MPVPSSARCGVAGVEARHERHVLDHRVGDAEVGEHVGADALERRELEREGQHALGQHVRHALVDPDRHLRRVAGARERVQHVAGALPARGEVERPAVVAGQVRDVVHRRGDVVDRHEVGPADLEPDQREPLGQRVPRLLDHLEEVVGPVDLVHLAGARVADDDARPVDAPRALDALAHELLGLVLRPVVGGGQLLPLVEHVLGEVALVLAGDRDRGRVVERARLQVVRQVDRVLGAADVEERVLRLVRGHVVDRGEVEEVVHAPAQRVARLRRDAEVGLREVPADGVDAAGAAEPLDDRLELLLAAGAHEHVDLALAREQPLDQMAADEAGPPRHEVGRHVFLSSVVACPERGDYRRGVSGRAR